MNAKIAFRLVGISSDLEILKAHFEHTEEQEKQLRLLAEDIRNDLLKDISSVSQDDREARWQFAHHVYDDYVEFRLPRILYYPFLVSLYGVYESAVTEIASLVQEKSGTNESLANPKGKDILYRANKYFRITLKYELSQNNQAWERMRILTEIRHAIAHAILDADPLADITVLQGGKHLTAIIKDGRRVDLNGGHHSGNFYLKEERLSFC